jgi:hypothetical protein
MTSPRRKEGRLTVTPPAQAIAAPNATQPPADLVLAWITAPVYDELAAWKALYDARYPAPAGHTGSVLDRRAA